MSVMKMQTSWSNFSNNVTNHLAVEDTLQKKINIPTQTELISVFVMAILGIFGNVFAVSATLRLIRRCPLATNYFVCSLSWLDLAGVSSCLLPTCFRWIFGEWKGGPSSCWFQAEMLLFCSICSCVLTSIMSIDRLYAVKKPFLYRQEMTLGKAKTLVIISVALSLVVSSAPLFGLAQTSQDLEETYCTFDWFRTGFKSKLFGLFLVLLYVTLVCVVLGSNICVIRILMQSRVGSKIWKRKGSDAITDINQAKVFTFNISRQKDIEIQFSQMIAVISVVFVICRVPFLISEFGSLFGHWQNSIFGLYVTRLLILNFVLDPFIYVITRKQYWYILLEVTSCGCTSPSETESMRSSSRLFHVSRSP